MCVLTEYISTCDDQTASGGAYRVAIVEQADITAYTMTSGEVSAMTSANPFVEIGFISEKGSLADTFAKNQDGTGGVWTVNFTAILGALSGTALRYIDNLAACGCPFTMAIETDKGIFLAGLPYKNVTVTGTDISGKGGGVRVTAADAQSGTAFADASTASVTLTETRTRAMVETSLTFAALLAL